MTRLGECANCGSDVMLVNFDNANGCRFCISCSRRGPDAILVEEAAFAAAEEPTLVTLSPEEPTHVSEPDPFLVAMMRGGQS
jgi:hypothetical protein